MTLPEAYAEVDSYATFRRAQPGDGPLRMSSTCTVTMLIGQLQESASRIPALRKSLKLSQCELADALNASHAAVCRWEQAEQKPPIQMCIRLGCLADTSACWYFWGMAELSMDDVMRVLPVFETSRVERLPVLAVARAGATQKPTARNIIAVPLLPAAAGGNRTCLIPDLNLVEPEAMLGAPRLWCPHPAYTSSLRVRGRSMEPVLHDGYIIVVDAYEKDRKKLRGEIVVAFSSQCGLFVSRLMWNKPSYVLVPDNKKHGRIPLSVDCRIVGKVLWWIGLADGKNASAGTAVLQSISAIKPGKPDGHVRR